MLLKSFSTSTGRICWKTVHLVQFEDVKDANDFLMWWYTKNGSIKAWLGEDFRGRSEKQKATDPIEDLCKPLEKKIMMATIKEALGPPSRPIEDLRKSERKQPLQPLLDLTNTKHGLKGSNKSKDDGGNGIKSKVTDAGVNMMVLFKPTKAKGRKMS